MKPIKARCKFSEISLRCLQCIDFEKCLQRIENKKAISEYDKKEFKNDKVI